jgi:hypothetical protein
MKIQTELPVCEVIQPFEPRNKHYVSDRMFRLNAKIFDAKGKERYFRHGGCT